jgi:hypothetical protein
MKGHFSKSYFSKKNRHPRLWGVPKKSLDKE